ncbi:MAG: hypothetical protein F6J98_08680 [Moorea sp. SIO4G2]|nr:hypothetical protein [Moorena sp. SIO4G2]
MFEKYQMFGMSHDYPPNLGDFEPNSPQIWGARERFRVASNTFKTASKT